MLFRIQKSQARKSGDSRAIMLAILIVTMAGGYAFSYAMSPLQSLLLENYGWSPADYGRYCSAASFLNVYLFILLMGGVAVDRLGAGRSGIGALLLMTIGGIINYVALLPGLEEVFSRSFINNLFNLPDTWWNITPFATGMPASAKLSSIGLMIFGSGMEICGIAVSRITVARFRENGLSLAMGLQLGAARMMMALAILSSYRIATGGPESSAASPLFACVLLILAGLITFSLYVSRGSGNCSADPKTSSINIHTLTQLIRSSIFIFPAIVCMMYYGSVYPFMKFAVNIMQASLGVSASTASSVLFILPLGSALLLPPICSVADKKKAYLPILRIGTTLLIPCLLLFALPVNITHLTTGIAYCAVACTALSTAMVAASVWPLIANILPDACLGSAYGAIYWLQGVALMAMPIMAGMAEEASPDCNFSAAAFVFIIPAVIAAVATLFIKMPKK